MEEENGGLDSRIDGDVDRNKDLPASSSCVSQSKMPVFVNEGSDTAKRRHDELKWVDRKRRGRGKE